MALQIRRGLEADRLSITPAQGEPIWCEDTQKLYVGDGVTPGGVLVTDGYVPDTRTITINGTTYDLSADRTWSVGTVTSVSGTAPVVSSGGTTPAISMAKADASTDGYLSKTDWSTFNSKGTGTVTSVSGTSPIASSGGTTPAISIANAKADGSTKGAAAFNSSDFDDNGSGVISFDYTNAQKASGSQNGILTSADWTTFNNKGSVNSVSGTSPISSSGGTTPAISIANAAADGSTKGAAAFTASDFNDNGSGVISLDYANGQKASGSQPGFLSSADWTTFNSKGTGTVTSVSGSSPISSSGGATPAISIANAAADGSTKGAAAFTASDFNDNGSGVISFDYTNAQKASGAQNGILTSTDWTTFNNKQNALSTGNLTESTSSVLTITGGTTAVIGAGTSIQVKQAGVAQSGYLSSTDWNTFNGKSTVYTGTATLNYGSAPGTNVVTTTVVDSNVRTASVVEAFVMLSTTATHNAYEHAVAPIKLTCGNIVDGVGFDIMGVTDWRLTGTFTVTYIIR